MSPVATKRVLTFLGLGVLVVVSGRTGFGQGPVDQVGAPDSALTTPGTPPPLGLGLGHASSAEVLTRIADRSAGHVAVDPYSLTPPALSPDANSGFVWHDPKPYSCWVVEARERRDYAPGTAVACYVNVTLDDEFVNGDGAWIGPVASPMISSVSNATTT